MRTMLHSSSLAVAFVVLCSGFPPAVHSQILAQPKNLIFSTSQLSGWWAESYSDQPACHSGNVRTRQVFSEDGKHLQFVFDRPWKTELGMKEKIGTTIVSSTERTLVIRYDGETRKKQSGQPVEWELSIAAPGVYRWRETEWKPGEVNTVVGIRCQSK